jgi:hypothetical protein
VSDSAHKNAVQLFDPLPDLRSEPLRTEGVLQGEEQKALHDRNIGRGTRKAVQKALPVGPVEIQMTGVSVNLEKRLFVQLSPHNLEIPMLGRCFYSEFTMKELRQIGR